MKKAILFFIFLLIIPIVYAPVVSHSADEVLPGIFAAGSFTFPNNLALSSGTLSGQSWSIAADGTTTGLQIDGGQLTGTISNGQFSAYSDLGAEGYLNNNANNDLLTRTQSDGRYISQVSSGEGTKGGAGSGTATIEFDCSEVAGTHLGCSGEDLYVSTDFEEENHCTEHDGTGLSCSGEELYIQTTYRGADARCGNNQFLDGDGDCRTTSQIVADGGGLTSCSSCDSRFVNEGQSNSISSGMVNFNYAGSSSEGGKANDADKLDNIDSSGFCQSDGTNCPSLSGSTELGFTAGGGGTDVSYIDNVDNQIGNIFNWHGNFPGAGEVSFTCHWDGADTVYFHGHNDGGGFAGWQNTAGFAASNVLEDNTWRHLNTFISSSNTQFDISVKRYSSGGSHYLAYRYKHVNANSAWSTYGSFFKFY